MTKKQALRLCLPLFAVLAAVATVLVEKHAKATARGHGGKDLANLEDLFSDEETQGYVEFEDVLACYFMSGAARDDRAHRQDRVAAYFEAVQKAKLMEELCELDSDEKRLEFLEQHRARQATNASRGAQGKDELPPELRFEKDADAPAPQAEEEWRAKKTRAREQLLKILEGEEDLELDDILDALFLSGMTTQDMECNIAAKRAFLLNKMGARMLDTLASTRDNDKALECLGQYASWKKTDEERNNRDEIKEEAGGSGRGLFNFSMKVGRIEKLMAYLENRELMNEIAQFPIRHGGAELRMQNGELDSGRQADEEAPGDVEPFAVIECASVRKMTVDGDIWHSAVFLPDYLLLHENRSGGCLVVWKNGQHVASFPWSEDLEFESIALRRDFTAKLKTAGSAPKTLTFNFAKPNGSELLVEQ